MSYKYIDVKFNQFYLCQLKPWKQIFSKIENIPKFCFYCDGNFSQAIFIFHFLISLTSVLCYFFLIFFTCASNVNDDMINDRMEIPEIWTYVHTVINTIHFQPRKNKIKNNIEWSKFWSCSLYLMITSLSFHTKTF